MRHFQFLLIFLILPTGYNLSYTQDIKKEVKVVKPYEPTLSDAVKINFMPKINDTTTLSTDFNYAIEPKVMDAGFNPRPISAAKMVNEPLPKLYKSHLKVGFGNYFTPLIELSLHNLRSKNLSYGANVNHISSHGKIKLENEEKVFAGYSNTSFNLFGKKILKNSVIAGDINIYNNVVHHYGYNPDLDTTLEKEDIRQSFINVGINTKYYSTYLDSLHVNYSGYIDYAYFTDANDNFENSFYIGADFDKIIEKQDVGLNFSLQHFALSGSIDSSNNTILGISPWISRHGSEWRYQLGFNTYFDMAHSETKVHFSPRAQLQFVVVENILVPYIGITGNYEANNYRKIALENPFIIPNLHVKNTNHKIIAYTGLKGRYSKDISFNIKASYSIIEDLYFYVNDSNSILENQFDVTYDNAEVANIYADFSYTFSPQLSFTLKGNYYNYQLNDGLHAWYRPDFDVTLSSAYNLRNKIFVYTDIIGIGKRYAKLNGADDSKELPANVDLNLAIEYQYTKNLSAFLRINNILGSKYYFYNFYPSQGFNFMAGFTYSL
ncbi:MAG: hypothetical protein JXB49_06835 [Bacteroidales bacterium]|nr:hypothetical protein [Bacteroidales bacterium]